MQATPNNPNKQNILEQEHNALEELNLLMGGGLAKQRVQKEEVQDGYGEDGYPVEEEDPLEYISGSQDRSGEEYKVVYSRIAIRKRPSSDAKVIGAAVKGDSFQVFEWDPSRTWRKIHFRLRGGWGSKVAAWVMVRHPKLGTLLRPVNAPDEYEEPPEPPAAQKPAREVDTGPQMTEGLVQPLGGADLELAAREVIDKKRFQKSSRRRPLGELDMLRGARPQDDDGEESEPEDEGKAEDGYEDATGEELLQSQMGGLTYQVVYKPFLAIRSEPSSRGRIIRSMEYGSYVDTYGWDATKTFRKIYCKMGTRGGVPRYIKAWMMTSHPDIGTLLEPAVG